MRLSSGRRSLADERMLSNTNNRKDTNMNSQILGLRVASVIFGLISLAQLLRLVIQPVSRHLKSNPRRYRRVIYKSNPQRRVGSWGRKANGNTSEPSIS